MKRFKILAVIAIIALAGCLVFACSSGSDSGGDDAASGSSAVNGFQGGKGGSGGGGGGGGATTSDPGKIQNVLDPKDEGKVVYDPKTESWTINDDITVPKGSDNIKFVGPVAIPDGVTIAIAPGKTVTFADPVDADSDFVVDALDDETKGGTVVFNMDSTIGGDLVIENGTVELQPTGTGKSTKLTVEGEIEITSDGKLVVPTKGFVDAKDNVTVEGKLVLDGEFTIANDKEITLVKGDGDGENKSFGATGDGTLVANGTVNVKVWHEQLSGTSGDIDKTTLIPLTGTAVFNTGSQLQVSPVVDTSGTSPLVYTVFGKGDENIKPDFAITGGRVVVTGFGKKQNYTLESVGSTAGTVNVVGGFNTTDGFGITSGTSVVVLWADFDVKENSTLSVGTSGTPSYFIIPSQFTLTIDKDGGSGTAGSLAVASTVLTQGGKIVNYGTASTGGNLKNNGTITNGGYITIPSGGILTNAAAVAEGATVTVPDIAPLSKGEIENQKGAIITFEGTITNDGKITNAGTISKEGSGSAGGSGEYVKSGTNAQPATWPPS